MKLLPRFFVAIGVIITGLIAQTLLFAHLNAVNRIPQAKLTDALSKFPKQLGSWQGEDLTIGDDLRYADEHFSRRYINETTHQQVWLWMVYSATAEDRGHNPEVCFQVAGQREDPYGRREVEVEGHESPVQQMRFGDADKRQLVYYWHYALPSPEVEGLNALQRKYQEWSRSKASITLEVFAPEAGEGTAEGAIEFVKLADAAIQHFVGPGARRGCDRRFVTLTGEEGGADH